jgi:hypothetical protein
LPHFSGIGEEEEEKAMLSGIYLMSHAKTWFTLVSVTSPASQRNRQDGDTEPNHARSDIGNDLKLDTAAADSAEVCYQRR